MNGKLIIKRIFNFSKDVRLGRLIREEGISVMRISEEITGESEWSSCNSKIGFNYTHNGEWGEGDTPLEAVKHIAK